MLKRLTADLRATIQEGIDSGPAIAAKDVFAELTDRYAEPKSAAKPPPRAVACALLDGASHPSI